MCKKEAILELENISKQFLIRDNVRNKQTFYSVDSVDLKLYNKEILGLVGESGSGKTTLSECVIGLTQLSGGSVKLFGKQVESKRTKEEKHTIQMIFQNGKDAFNPRMNVYDILKEPLYINRNFIPKENQGYDRIIDILEKVGLDESYLFRFPHELSGGQLQRIGIARAIIAEPRIIICDEPVASLDVSTQRQILKLLYDIHKSREVSYIFISHDLAVVNKISDRIAVMYKGRIVELADKESLFKRRRHPYSIILYNAIPDANKELNFTKTIEQADCSVNSEGCAFESRCRYATEICHRKKPTLEEVAANHFVACFQKDKIISR